MPRHLRMGPDPASAVVDPRLRVHGLERLRVIDASVFPRVTSGNTNAPAIMVGERGSRLVLEEATERVIARSDACDAVRARRRTSSQQLLD